MELKVLFVCTGNICRSPSAEYVAKVLVQQRQLENNFSFVSAGTHAYHLGELADERSRAAAKRRGYDLAPHQARQLSVADFDKFDYLIAMDASHLRQMRKLCPQGQSHKLHLLGEYSKQFPNLDVEDPYYGGPAGFVKVLEQLEEAIGEFITTAAKTVTGNH